MARSASVFAVVFLFALALSAKPRTATVISLGNEKVYLSPIVDSSSLQSLEGWPKDSQTARLLLSHFDELHDNLIAEFRRCEKFGYYEMVDDSAAATVRIQLVTLPYSFVKDTLTIPVRVEIHHRTGIDTFTRTVRASGIYRPASKPESPLAYVDNLLADYRRYFPYRTLVALFYPPR